MNENRTEPSSDTSLTQAGSADVPRGWVYFIQAGDTIKIGHSTKLTRRLTALQTGHSTQLRLLAKTPGSKDTESEYHRKYARFRVRGEWFKAAKRLLEEIDLLNGARPARHIVRRPKPFPPMFMENDLKTQITLLYSRIRRLKDDPVEKDRLCLLAQQLKMVASGRGGPEMNRSIDRQMLLIAS